MVVRRNIIQDIIKTRGTGYRSRPPEAVDPSREKVLRGRGVGPRVWTVRILILLVLLILAIWASSVFGYVEVLITPHSRLVTIDANDGGSFIAREVPLAVLFDIGDYDVVEISQTAQMQLTATGQEFVERKARGIITIFNDHSPKNERLVANTRFESPDGKIYRIEKAVSVPGKTSTGPGRLEVEVIADDFGDDFNLSGDVRFTVPGLVDDERFGTIYATLKLPINSGFSGIQKSASASDIESATRSVREEASKNIAVRLADSIPSDQVLFDDAVIVQFARTPGDASEGSGDEYVVEGTATAYGIVFNRIDFSQLLARRHVEGYNEKPILIENLDSIDFNFSNKDSFVPGETDQIIFSVSGPLHFVWQYDTDQLLTELVGLKKDQFQQIFLSYSSSILRAESHPVPSWRRFFPDDPAKIRIVRVLESDE